MTDTPRLEEQYEGVLMALMEWADKQSTYIDGASFAAAVGYAAAGIGVSSKQPTAIRKIMTDAYDSAVRKKS